MKRIYSLDVLRGLAIFLMIFIDAAPIQEETYPILAHALWEGLTLADLPFPCFVFVMGMSAAISMARRVPSTKKILKRAAILFALGVLFNSLDFILSWLLLDDFTSADFFKQAVVQIRPFGILQRLALVYLFGTLLARAIKNDAGIFIAAVVLLILSSAGFHIYAPDNPFAIEHNISSAVDLIFPGANHIYEENYDPEGLYGTIASVTSFLIGYLAGRILIDNASARDKIFLLGVAGVIFFIAGGVWSNFDIIAKKLWTAPYTLINAGIDVFLLIVLTYLPDKIPKLKKFLQPLNALGTNPLFFFLMSGFALVLVFTMPLEIEGVLFYLWIYQYIFYNLIGPEIGSMIFCLLWSLLWLPLAEIFYRRGIVIKI